MGCFEVKYKRYIKQVYRGKGMQHLTFYAHQHVKKLPKIGRFLRDRIIRDLRANRRQFVEIGVNIFVSLTQSCATSLDRFITSFFDVIEQLIVSKVEDLQILGTNSFIEFSKIEEEGHSPNRKYDLFLDKFSEMSWRGTNNTLKIRLAGLKGLRAVLKKTQHHEAIVNLWEPTTLEKIIPVILHNLESHSDEASDIVATDDAQSKEPASECLRDLIKRASLGNVRPVLKPIFRFLEQFHHWSHPSFLEEVFRILILSVQQPVAHVMFAEILTQLTTANPPETRAGMLELMVFCVKLTNGTVIGSSIIEVFHMLVQLVRDFPNQTDPVFDALCRGIVHAFSTFALHLSESQLVDVLGFLATKLKASGGIRYRQHILESITVVAAAHAHTPLPLLLPAVVLDAVLDVMLEGSSELCEYAVITLRDILTNQKPRRKTNDDEMTAHSSYGYFLAHKQIFSAILLAFDSHNDSKIKRRVLELVRAILLRADPDEALHCAQVLLSIKDADAEKNLALQLAFFLEMAEIDNNTALQELVCHHVSSAQALSLFTNLVPVPVPEGPSWSAESVAAALEGSLYGEKAVILEKITKQIDQRVLAEGRAPSSAVQSIRTHAVFLAPTQTTSVNINVDDLKVIASKGAEAVVEGRPFGMRFIESLSNEMQHSLSSRDRQVRFKELSANPFDGSAFRADQAQDYAPPLNPTIIGL